MNQEMVEVRTIADGFLNYTKATAISLNGIRLLCYLGILCRVALTDHSTRKIPGRYHIYILLLAAADMVLTGNSDLYNRIPGAAAVAGPMLVLSILIPGAFGGGDITFRISAWKRENHLFDGMCGYACRRILPYYVEMWKADQKG